MTTLQIRIDEDLKRTAEKIFEEIGLDLSTAIRMFLRKSCVEKGLPFDPKIDEDEFNWLLSMKIYTLTNEEEERFKDLSLEEINSEIKEYRKTRNKNN